MRMRQSLADFESAFVEDLEIERERDERQLRQAIHRNRKRRIDHQHRRGTMRYVLLVLALLGTAVLVTIAMFQALYAVMG